MSKIDKIHIVAVVSKPCNFNICRKWLLDSTLDSLHLHTLCPTIVLNQNSVKKHCLEVKLSYTTDNFTIFWETINSNPRFWQFVQKNRPSFCTCRKLFFQFKQNPLCSNIIFAHQDWHNLHNKSFLPNFLKRIGQILVFGDIFSIQNIVGTNLTWIWTKTLGRNLHCVDFYREIQL